MTTVQINLPESLAEEARRAGLLASDKIEALLRQHLKRQRVDELFTAMDRMALLNEPAAMTPEELAEEIRALRAQRGVQR